jgi:hypothetical protein
VNKNSAIFCFGKITRCCRFPRWQSRAVAQKDGKPSNGTANEARVTLPANTTTKSSGDAHNLFDNGVKNGLGETQFAATIFAVCDLRQRVGRRRRNLVVHPLN